MNGFLRRILFLPSQSSTVAVDLDQLHYFVILVTMAGATLVTLVGLYFLVRYRRQLGDRDRPNPDASARPHFLFKLSSLGALVVLFLVWWVIGARQYMRLRVAPEGAMDVYVTAKQWMWKFAYPEGARSIATLYVPAGRPVRLIMTSRDVIHSFFVPDFRVKQDVLPGRYTTLWFQALSPGTHQILCTQYCGTGHSTMRGEVVVLRAEDFARWIDGRAPAADRLAGPRYVEPSLGLVGAAEPPQPLSLVRVGERVAAEQGCYRCHTIDGNPHIGPTWAGLYEALVPLEGGGEVVADVAYLTESIMDPKAKIHRGYQPVMPSYLGRLDAPETAAIVELIKSLRDVRPAPGARTPLEAQPPGDHLEEGAQGRGERRAPPPPEPPGGEIRTLDGGAAMSDTLELAGDDEPTSGLPGDDPPDYLRADAGIASWLLTTDHKRIGLMFYVLILGMLALGGSFALLLRTELLTPERSIMSAGTYNRMFTLHGITMVWLFLIPSIPNSFGNFLLPIMIGARDLAFPRLNLLSLYVYVAGAILLLTAMIWGGADTGWTFYAPYSTTTPTAIVPVVLGIFVLGVSSIMTAVNFIVTTHTLRARGMTWFRLPLFVWGIYATSVIMLLATPVLGLSVMLIGLDHVYRFGIFDPALGGDPMLFQHLFWFYSHPAVYIMILPAMGVIATVCTFSRKRPNSYTAIAVSSVGIAVVGFFTWGHHMFVAGMSELDAGIFGSLSMFVALFSAIKVFTWVATMYRGQIHFNTPMLYFFWFLFLFVFGGMTGVAVATQSLDVHWHDTYFVVAHFHFIMVGGSLTAFLSAAHYWFPKMFGRLYSERVGLLTSVAVFLGFVLTFLPQFLAGNAGMPRRYYSYPSRYQWLNVLSTGGAYLLAGALFLTALNLLVALRWGARSGRNPWRSRSFEWEAPSPPPKWNFVEPPVIDRGPYDYELSEEEAHARAHAT